MKRCHRGRGWSCVIAPEQSLARRGRDERVDRLKKAKGETRDESCHLRSVQLRIPASFLDRGSGAVVPAGGRTPNPPEQPGRLDDLDVRQVVALNSVRHGIRYGVTEVGGVAEGADRRLPISICEAHQFLFEAPLSILKICPKLLKGKQKGIWLMDLRARSTSRHRCEAQTGSGCLDQDFFVFFSSNLRR